jgi:hypothetical protein
MTSPSIRPSNRMSGFCEMGWVTEPFIDAICAPQQKPAQASPLQE